MKRIVSILCLFCLLIGCSQSNTDYLIELDEKDGIWSYEINEQGIVEIDQERESNVSAGDVSGIYGKETFTIHGEKEGTVTITFTNNEDNLSAVYTLKVDSNLNVKESEHSGSYFDTGLEEEKVEEVSEKEMTKETGIDLPSTKKMSDVHYAVLDLNGTKISQMNFTLDDKKYCYRAAYTTSSSLDEVQDISRMDKSRVGISEDRTIQDYSARAYDRGDGSGYIIWIDTNAGIVYTLSMNEDVDTLLLAQTATTIFVPVTGE